MSEMAGAKDREHEVDWVQQLHDRYAHISTGCEAIIGRLAVTLLQERRDHAAEDAARDARIADLTGALEQARNDLADALVQARSGTMTVADVSDLATAVEMADAALADAGGDGGKHG